MSALGVGDTDVPSHKEAGAGVNETESRDESKPGHKSQLKAAAAGVHQVRSQEKCTWQGGTAAHGISVSKRGTCGTAVAPRDTLTTLGWGSRSNVQGRGVRWRTGETAKSRQPWYSRRLATPSRLR